MEICVIPSTRQIVSVGLLFLLLVAIAEWAAGIQAEQAAVALHAGIPQPIGNPWKGTSVRDFHYFATINAVTVSIILLIPAIGAYILRRPYGPGPGWLIFWTAAYLVFVLHLYHGIHGVFADHWNWIFHDRPNLDAGKPLRVTNPYGDMLIAVWWTFDVILVWIATKRLRWIRAERSILHIVLFGTALVSSIVLSSNGY